MISLGVRVMKTSLTLTFAMAVVLPDSAVSQVMVMPELSGSDPRLATLRKKFQGADRETRRLDTYVDVRVPGNRREQQTIERIVHGYLAEVGAEPISLRQARNATFRIEISSIQKIEQGDVKQTVFMILYDRTLAQGERPIMRSRTDLQCNKPVFGKDYSTFAAPPTTCIRDESHLREAFLRLR